MNVNRRQFLIGCSTAIAALGGSRLSELSFAAGDKSAEHCLVVVFLRGGWDALSVLSPLEGLDREQYIAARPNLYIPDKNTFDLSNGLGLHKGLESLWDLYTGKTLAVIPGVGMPFDSRSHFDAMASMELGLPGKTTGSAGWLARAIDTAPEPSVPVKLAATMSAGNSIPGSLRGDLQTIAMPKLEEFQLADDANYRREMSRNLERLYRGNSWLHQAGRSTLRSLEIAAGLPKPKKGEGYPDTGLAQNLQTIAGVLRGGLGLRAATVDFGGWDTHEWQGDKFEGYFTDHLRELGGALRAFFNDLERSQLHTKVTTVVISEFGRRVQQNASYGTDHGHGSAMLVMGGGVNGGKTIGQFPGLHPDQLYDRADLAATTDYRQILSEILETKFNHKRLPEVFPDFKAGKALGVMKS